MRLVAWLVILVLLALLGGAAWLLLRPAPPAPPGPTNAPGLPTAASAPALARTPAPATRSAPASAAPAASTEPPAPVASEKPFRVATNVPGALVRLSIRRKGAVVETHADAVTADAGGVAEFPLPLPRAEIERFDAHAEAPGRVEARGWSTGEDLVLELQPGFEVSGRVRFPDGRPLPGALVHADRGNATATTDEDGRFTLSPVPEGQVSLICAQAGQEVTTRGGATDVEIVARRPVLRVRIVDAAGATVPRARLDLQVHVGDQRALWHVGGSTDDRPFTDSAPPGARVALRVTAEGFEGKSDEWTVGEEIGLQDRTVVLARPSGEGSLVLRVRTDPDPPPAKVRVTLLDETGFAIENCVYLEYPVVAGVARVDGVPSATRRVRVEAGYRGDISNFTIGCEVDARLEAGRETEIDVPLASGGRVRIVVKDAAGVMVPPGEFRVRDDRGREVEIDFGNPGDGGMRFPARGVDPAHGGRPLPPGRYEIELLRWNGKEQEVAARESFAVALRETVEVELVLAE